VAAVTALPSVIPLAHFIPDVERTISQRIRQPVSIKQLRFFLLPTPHLRASTVSIGRNGLLEVDAVTIYPTISTLFSDTKVIREVEVRGVKARFELLGAARTLLNNEAQRKRASSDEQGAVVVRRVTLRDVTLRFATFELAGVNVDVKLQDGKPSQISATQQRDHLQVSARRQAGDSWSLDIAARDWKLPVGLPLQFDRLEGMAIATASGIEAKKLSGSLYGGSFSGPVAISWKSGWSVAGQGQIDGVDLEPIVALLKREVAMSGKLTAAPTFTSQARDPAELLNALRLDSDFSIEHGVLYKIDLVAAAKNPLNRQAGKGGKTEFDELKGHLLLEQRAYEFTDLQIASGLFRAAGEVNVNEDKTLGGRVRAELRGTAALLSMPLDVSGTTADPSVFPTRGAMFGAVAGSVLMPGLGTAVGIKAGEFTEQLFGRKKKDKPKDPVQKERDQQSNRKDNANDAKNDAKVRGISAKG
jgi:uncharacterized protein involved in outer membrane biogenesis